jgi:Trk K+ transport system NAD-binding subunit
VLTNDSAGQGVTGDIDIEGPEKGTVVGCLIQEINIPDQCVVAAIIREEEFVVPRGQTEIRGGDHVVFVGPSESIQAAHKIFSAKE